VDNVLWLNDVISNRVEILTANTPDAPTADFDSND
jgi:hypothetical protein